VTVKVALDSLLSSIGTLVIGSVTAWASVKSTRKTETDKVLQAMKDEVALLKDWPEGSSARLELQRHLEWLARRYVAEQAMDMQVKIRWIRSTVAILLGIVILSAPTMLHETIFLAGSPLGITCVYWSIREMAGSNARRRLRRASTTINALAGASEDGESRGGRTS
jgi:hypothetical protein